jgi:DsbC/DsbD-like thiol-disulfide interchange protein
MRSFSRIAAVLTSIAVAAMAFAQGAPPVVTAQGPKAVIAGKLFSVTLMVTIPAGLHGYQNPPTDPTLIPISVSTGDRIFTISKVNYPLGKPEKIPGEDKPVNVYEGTIRIPVVMKAPTKLGKTTLKLTIKYQECNAQSCFPPGSVDFTSDVTVIKTLSPTLHK